MTMTAPTPDAILLGNTGPQPAMEPWQAEILAYANSLPALRPDPPIVAGRYSLPDPADASGKPFTQQKPEKWTRSSTFAKTLDDPYNIEHWTQRKVMEGLLAHPQIAAQIAAIADRESKEGKAEMHRLMDYAAFLAGRSLGADLGTAFHTIAEHADAGHPIMTGAWTPALKAYQDAFTREGMTVIESAIELVVVNTALGVAGRGDRFVMLEGRTHPLIADIKTGSTLNEVACAIQLAAYARASHIWTPEGYSAMPPVDLELGIIMHVDLEAGTCVMHALDIAEGWERCQVAAAARKARNGGAKLLVPLTPPTPVVANTTGPVAVATSPQCPPDVNAVDSGHPFRPVVATGVGECGLPDDNPLHVSDVAAPTEAEQVARFVADGVVWVPLCGWTNDPADVKAFQTSHATQIGAALAVDKNAGASTVSDDAAPSQGEVATEVTHLPPVASPDIDRTDWLMGRFRTLAADQRAREWLSHNWPADVPTAPPWTDVQVDTLHPCVELLETYLEAPFPAVDPAIAAQRAAESEAARTANIDPDVPLINRPVDDDGTPVDPATVEAVKAATQQWDQPRRDRAHAWGAEARRAGRPFNPGVDTLTARQGAILLAASACIDHLWDDDEPDTLTRHALAMAVDEDLQPGWSTGGVLGSLTTTQAQRLRQIAEAFTSASPNADADELGRRYLAATPAA